MGALSQSRLRVGFRSGAPQPRSSRGCSAKTSSYGLSGEAKPALIFSAAPPAAKGFLSRPKGGARMELSSAASHVHSRSFSRSQSASLSQVLEFFEARLNQ